MFYKNWKPEREREGVDFWRVSRIRTWGKGQHPHWPISFPLQQVSLSVHGVPSGHRVLDSVCSTSCSSLIPPTVICLGFSGWDDRVGIVSCHGKSNACDRHLSVVGSHIVSRAQQWWWSLQHTAWRNGAQGTSTGMTSMAMGWCRITLNTCIHVRIHRRQTKKYGRLHLDVGTEKKILINKLFANMTTCETKDTRA